VRLFEFIAVEFKCVGIIRRQVFAEGVECVPVMLDCTLEESFLGVLGGVLVSGMVGSRFVRDPSFPFPPFLKVHFPSIFAKTDMRPVPVLSYY